MKSLSDTLSNISHLASGPTLSTDLTPQHGSTKSAGLTSYNPDKARAWLADKRPEEVDAKILASLRSEQGVTLDVQTEWRFPEVGPAYRVPTTVGLTGLSTEKRQSVCSRIEGALTPLTRDQAEKLVAQMESVLPRQAKGAEGAELAFDVYVHVLMSHPADVAAEAVRRFVVEPRDGKSWFPAPSEIEKICRTLSEPRKAMLNAVQMWREVSDEEKHVQALYAAYRAKNTIASQLETKTGPGPATDTGPRGERIAAAKSAREEAQKAKVEWIEAQKAIDNTP